MREERAPPACFQGPGRPSSPAYGECRTTSASSEEEQLPPVGSGQGGVPLPVSFYVFSNTNHQFSGHQPTLST